MAAPFVAFVVSLTNVILRGTSGLLRGASLSLPDGAMLLRAVCADAGLQDALYLTGLIKHDDLSHCKAGLGIAVTGVATALFIVFACTVLVAGALRMLGLVAPVKRPAVRRSRARR